MEVNNNFPKLASSAATCSASPSLGEGGGGLGIDGKYQLDYQLVRGVNLMQLRMPLVRDGMTYQPGASTAGQINVPPQAQLLASYTNRPAT